MTDQPVVNDETSRLQKLADDHLEGWKRAKADYLNLKKQTDKEKQNIAQFAVAQTVTRFLGIYDNLNRALKHVPAEEREREWVKGVEATRKMFVDELKTIGLEIIPTVGHPFDPMKHHAVSNVPNTGQPSGTIIEELKAGFMAADRVLEPAQVTVAA